eukprot:8268404-Alexandrium_andersonii.AAC.1
MSASLVGSEMCIRDRTISVARQREARHCLRGQDLGQKDFKRQPRQLAVSYTHLTLPTICSV